MNVTLVQCDIAWEDKHANLSHYEGILEELSGKTDLVVLPEMCTTGFSMQTDDLSEGDEGPTMTAFSRMAKTYGTAITGSFIGRGDSATGSFNRGFFIHPDGSKEFRNKRHLFRMGEESKHYLPGNEKSVIHYMGWNIRLLICYDLRFPVWSRNVNNEYDLLVVCANWPQPRRHAWNNLLVARALENQCFVCGVNRVGTDGLGLNYTGDSCLIDAYGRSLTTTEPNRVHICTTAIELDALRRFRDTFPVWKDADSFQLE